MAARKWKHIAARAAKFSSQSQKWRFNNQGSWVISTPAVVQGKVLFATSDSSTFHVVDAATGKGLYNKPVNAYMFGSPAVAREVVYLGILNGVLQARDLKSGEVLWEFQTEASKQNREWALGVDRKFNGALLFRSAWREAPITSLERQFSVGSFFSSPLVANGTVYIGSADGYLYAIE